MDINAATDSRRPEEPYITHLRTSAGRYSAPARAYFRYMVCGVIAAFLIIMSFPCASVSEATDGKEYFRNGKYDLDAGRYEDAVRNLTAAVKEFPLLEDYSLLYLSEAYHNIGDHKKSLETFRTLLQKYPQSLLVKRARTAEIREAGENARESLPRLFESYVKDYPEDEEMNFMYGTFLKQSGETRRAKDVFRKIYLRAGSLAPSAAAELGPGDVSPSDLLERASNLMKKFEFREAEHDLRKALSLGDVRNREEILRSLGLSLFKQKEYREAAAVYEKIHDVYSQARSLYRAGDKQGFDAALRDLLEKNDRRAGGLLIAVASDKRRDGDFEGALKVFIDVANRYPSDAEEAMWGAGWTHYRAGEYRKSAEIFSKLHAKYDDPKYLYWRARSTEALGEDAKALYKGLIKYENSFYVALACARGKVKTDGVLSRELSADLPSGLQHQFERIDMLLSLRMLRETSAELQWLSKKIDTPSALIAVAAKFHMIGDYKRSVTLATRMPYSGRVHNFWYPLAFWDDVERISRKHDIDPMIALSVMREESRFDPEARSFAGARGLMQIMPQTAYRLDKNIRLGINRDGQINDIRNNIDLGVYYLKSLLREFRSLPHVLAAYNAGEAIVKKWEGKASRTEADEFIEEIPYYETRTYVKKVMTSYFQYKRSSPGVAASSGLLSGSL